MEPNDILNDPYQGRRQLSSNIILLLAVKVRTDLNLKFWRHTAFFLSLISLIKWSGVKGRRRYACSHQGKWILQKFCQSFL